MSFDNFELGIFALGTILISVGGTLTAIYTFQARLLPVLIGYLLFTIGYKLSWYGNCSSSSLDKLLNCLQVFDKSSNKQINGYLRKYSLVFAGLLMASFGTIRFGGMVVNELKMVEVAWAGILCFGGYMVAHVGVNEVLV